MKSFFEFLGELVIVATALLCFAIVLSNISGCAETSKYDVEAMRYETMRQNKVIDYHRWLASKPSHSLVCTSGCSLDIFDPSRLPEMPKINHFVGAHEANARMFEAGVSVVPDIMQFGVIGYAAHEAFNAAGGGNTNQTYTNTGDGDLTSTSSDTDTRTNTTTGATTDRHDTIDSHNAVSEPVIVKPSVVRPSVVKPEVIIVTP